MLTLYTGSLAGPLRLMGANIIRTAEFALLNQGWHSYRTEDRATCRALASLERAKVIEVKNDTHQFRWHDTRA